MLGARVGWRFRHPRDVPWRGEAPVANVELASASNMPTTGDYEQVVFTGCGSTYYLSLAAAALFQELTGCAARAVPAGELVLNSKTVLTDQKTLLVAISRSGTTSETLKAVKNFKAEKRGDVVVSIASAGHPPALWIHNGHELLAPSQGPPLGLEEDPDYTEGSLRLPGPAGLLLYTDGLVERRYAPMDEGMERLARLRHAMHLRRHGHRQEREHL